VNCAQPEGRQAGPDCAQRQPRDRPRIVCRLRLTRAAALSRRPSGHRCYRQGQGRVPGSRSLCHPAGCGGHSKNSNNSRSLVHVDPGRPRRQGRSSSSTAMSSGPDGTLRRQSPGWCGPEGRRSLRDPHEYCGIKSKPALWEKNNAGSRRQASARMLGQLAEPRTARLDRPHDRLAGYDGHPRRRIQNIMPGRRLVNRRGVGSQNREEDA
jgi:hypothetical protein